MGIDVAMLTLENRDLQVGLLKVLLEHAEQMLTKAASSPASRRAPRRSKGLSAADRSSGATAALRAVRIPGSVRSGAPAEAAGRLVRVLIASEVARSPIRRL